MKKTKKQNKTSDEISREVRDILFEVLFYFVFPNCFDVLCVCFKNQGF